jgi:hypothetical protein
MVDQLAARSKKSLSKLLHPLNYPPVWRARKPAIERFGHRPQYGTPKTNHGQINAKNGP